MDKQQKDWSVVVPLMPGVKALINEKRKEWGAAWVNECWKHGVVLGEPGWFFAREGAVAVGTPATADEGLLGFAFSMGAAPYLYILKPKDGPHGTTQ
jgi:hypothetical protein